MRLPLSLRSATSIAVAFFQLKFELGLLLRQAVLGNGK